MLKNEAAPGYVATKTSVWIDLDTCPIPDGCNAGQVRHRIESALDTIGCSGPLTLSVLGTLENISDDVLRAFSSTGIVVHYTPRGTGRGCGKMLSVLLDWAHHNRPPTHIVFASISRNVYLVSRCLCYLQSIGHSITVVYGDNPKLAPGLNHYSIWEWKRLLAERALPMWSVLPPVNVQGNSPAYDKCGAAFFCRLCCDYTTCKYFECQSFEDFSTHIHGEEHKLRYVDYYRIEDDEDEEDEDSLAVGEDEDSVSSSHPKKSKVKAKVAAKATTIKCCYRPRLSHLMKVAKATTMVKVKAAGVKTMVKSKAAKKVEGEEDEAGVRRGGL